MPVGGPGRAPASASASAAPVVSLSCGGAGHAVAHDNNKDAGLLTARSVVLVSLIPPTSKPVGLVSSRVRRSVRQRVPTGCRIQFRPVMARRVLGPSPSASLLKVRVLLAVDGAVDAGCAYRVRIGFNAGCYAVQLHGPELRIRASKNARRRAVRARGGMGAGARQAPVLSCSYPMTSVSRETQTVRGSLSSWIRSVGPWVCRACATSPHLTPGGSKFEATRRAGLGMGEFELAGRAFSDPARTSSRCQLSPRHLNPLAEVDDPRPMFHVKPTTPTAVH